MTLAQLRTATKHAMSNRTATTGVVINDAWYTDRVNSGMRRLCSFQGMVTRPGMKQPQFRVLRFFELESRVVRPIDTTATSNYILPAIADSNFLDPPRGVAAIIDVYDRTNARGLNRVSRREMMSLNPERTGRPRRWCPFGQDGQLVYAIDAIPATTSDEIEVYEWTYLHPVAMTDDDESPVIPEAWHVPIWYAAVAEAATLVDWPDRAQEYESKFMSYVAERKSPHEEADVSGYAGARRNLSTGIGISWSRR
jgi:hypothetical protein